MKVLLVHDVGPPSSRPWAQYRHTSGLAKFTPEGIEPEAVDNGTYSKMQTPQLARYDAVYIVSLYAALWKEGVKRLASCVASHAWKYETLDHDNWRTFGVNKWRNNTLGKRRVKQLDAVVCRNQELGRWAAQQNAQVAVFPIGIDRSIFQPVSPRKVGSVLRIGWCAQIGGITNFKGHDEILVPLMKTLGGRYDWTVNTKHYKNAWSTEQMIQWYQSLDVYLSTSSDDATPNGPFEAAACGVPVVSTDVGCVADWAAIREAGLVVPSYGNEEEAVVTRKAITRKLRELENATRRRHLREVLLQSIADEYDYVKIAPETLRFIAGKLSDKGVSNA